MNEIDKEELIYRYVESYNNKDVSGMLKCVTDDVIFRNIAGGVVQMEMFDKDSLKELAEKTLNLFKTREQTIKKITFDEDKARIDIHFEAEFGISLPNGVKAGDKIAVDGYSEFEFRDNLISVIADCS